MLQHWDAAIRAMPLNRNNSAHAGTSHLLLVPPVRVEHKRRRSFVVVHGILFILIASLRGRVSTVLVFLRACGRFGAVPRVRVLVLQPG